MSSFEYDDEDDQSEDWDGPITGRNCFVLLIDAGEEMFNKKIDGKSYFQLSMECCKEILLSIARKQKMELVSFILFGTQKSEGKYAPENVVLYQPLSVVTASRIKQLGQLIENKCEEIKTNYRHAKQFVMAHALHYSQAVILQSKAKVYVKNIILFTCNDNPHPDDSQMQYQTRKQAEELLGNHINLDIVGLGKFDSSVFYKELVLTSRGELLRDWVNHDPILDMSKLMDQIDRITEKFSLRRSHLRLGSECSLQVSLCKLYNEPKKFRTEKVTAEEKQILEATSRADERMECEDEGGNEEAQVIESIPKPESIYRSSKDAFVVLGGHSVPISRAELKDDILGLNLGFTLVGFVNTDDIPFYFFKGEPFLVLPASNAVNPRLIFSHLLNACLNRKKSMVGWFKLTKSSNPCYVVLHPTLEGEYSKSREHSAGFIMNKLSFSDDFVEQEEAEESEAEPSTSQQEAADKIIQKMTINYTVDMFSDAEVRYRTNMIEALALDYDDVEPVEDDTDVDLEGIAERLGDLSEAFNNCDHLGPEEGTSGKRSTTAKTPLSAANGLEMIQQGLAAKLSVAQLKDLLKNEGIKSLSAMNKSLLVSLANKRFGGPQN